MKATIRYVVQKTPVDEELARSWNIGGPQKDWYFLWMIVDSESSVALSMKKVACFTSSNDAETFMTYLEELQEFHMVIRELQEFHKSRR